MARPRIKLPDQVLYALVEDAAGDVYSVKRRDMESWEILELLQPEISELQVDVAASRLEERRTKTTKPARNRMH